MTRRVLLFLALPLAAGASLGPRYGGELAVAVEALPSSFEPRSPQDKTSRFVLGLVHETLVRTSGDGAAGPSLAVSFHSASEGREWTLTLKDGLHFHDAAEIHSADVVRSLRRFLRSGSSAAEVLARSLEGGAACRGEGDCPGIDILGEGRIVLRFSSPGALPLGPLASMSAAITSARGSGAGPFLPSAQVPGRRLGLVAFTGHVRGRPFLDRIEVLPSASPQADVKASRSDLAPGPQGSLTSLASSLFLVLDKSQPPFDRPEARRAVAAAIDPKDLVRNLLPGGEAGPSLLVPGLLAPLPAATPRPSPGPLTGRISLAVDRDVPPIVSQRIVALLAAKGLAVEASPAGGGKGRNAELVLFCPEVAESGLALREIAARSHAPLEALDSALLEADLDRRRAGILRFEAELLDSSVVLPLASVPVSFLARGSFHGARVDLTGRLDLEDAWLEP